MTDDAGLNTRRPSIAMGRAMSTEPPITLDSHRGMAAQKATELRPASDRGRGHEKMLRDRHDELQMRLVALPSANWKPPPRKPAI